MVDRSSSLEDLPEELLFNILSRLPPKTLICLTPVCKLWLRLIRSSQFAHYHYATRSNLLGDSSQYVFAVDELNSAAPKILFIPYDTLELNVNDPISLTIFECKRFCPLRGRDCGDITYEITGPCNGIFCLQIYFSGLWFSPILLWNPATNETRDVSCIAKNFEQLGFGFDSKTCDYKVVCTRFRGDGYKVNELVEVYSLNSDSWKTLNASYFFDGNKIFCPTYEHSCSSNGRMFNWIGCHVSSCDSQYLITFDMSEEVFIQTPLPGSYKLYDFIKQLSDNTQACIAGCELCINNNSRRVDIWVLDSDYGPNASWTMLRSVVISTRDLWGDDLFGFWKDGELLFEMARKLFAHDPASEHVRQLGGVEADFTGDWLPRKFSSSCVGYTQSLVSVKRRGGRGKQERIQNGGQKEVYSLGKVNEQDHANLFKVEIEFPF